MTPRLYERLTAPVLSALSYGESKHVRVVACVDMHPLLVPAKGFPNKLVSTCLASWTLVFGFSHFHIRKHISRAGFSFPETTA